MRRRRMLEGCSKLANTKLETINVRSQYRTNTHTFITRSLPMSSFQLLSSPSSSDSLLNLTSTIFPCFASIIDQQLQRSGTTRYNRAHGSIEQTRNLKVKNVGVNNESSIINYCTFLLASRVPYCPTVIESVVLKIKNTSSTFASRQVKLAIIPGCNRPRSKLDNYFQFLPIFKCDVLYLPKQEKVFNVIKH